MVSLIFLCEDHTLSKMFDNTGLSFHNQLQSSTLGICSHMTISPRKGNALDNPSNERYPSSLLDYSVALIRIFEGSNAYLGLLY